MEKQKITGSEALLKALIAEGVDTIFGYPGGQAIPIYDSLYDSGIRNILVRQEQNGGHMASGYARVTRKPAVCVATSGPFCPFIIITAVSVTLRAVIVAPIKSSEPGQSMKFNFFPFHSVWKGVANTE